jgi:hypothetical protein
MDKILACYYFFPGYKALRPDYKVFISLGAISMPYLGTHGTVITYAYSVNFTQSFGGHLL